MNNVDHPAQLARPSPNTFYGDLPILGRPVQVQCDGFKCMAYRNKHGRWVNLFTGEFLAHVLGVVPG